MNRGTYKFVSKIYNLPSSKSVSNYDSVDDSSKDGVLYGVSPLIDKRSEVCDKKKIDGGGDEREWRCMRSSGSDSMSMKKKGKHEAHLIELVGCEEGARKEDVLLQELLALDTDATNYDDKKKRPTLSK